MVIVVEESVETRAAIGSALRDDGHEVVEVSDGSQLLARLMSLVALRGHRRDSIAVVAGSDAPVLAVLRMLRTARWRTPVLLVEKDESRSAARDLEPLASFQRPVDMGALRAAVWRAVPPPRLSGATD